jgi:hypothetical protein
MSIHAKGTFALKSFDEETFQELDGGTKLTRARIVVTMSGDLEGEATSDALMYYLPDGTASFTGYQRFVGRIGDGDGSFVMMAVGGYDGSEATTTTTVVTGSGTGALVDIRGEGSTAVGHDGAGTYSFDYELG